MDHSPVESLCKEFLKIRLNLITFLDNVVLRLECKTDEKISNSLMKKEHMYSKPAMGKRLNLQYGLKLSGH